MSFTVLPAVDVAGGRVVRAGGTDVDPREVALSFQGAGARWIHLVDLDAAYGRGSNLGLLTDVIGALAIDVELSGGIDDEPSVERALATRCARVNVGTAALADRDGCARVIEAHRERIAICLDVGVVGAEHRLVARGAGIDVGDLWETLAALDGAGCARYVVTDVSRDGSLAGPNVELCRAVAVATPAKVIASGGVSSIDDLLALAAIDPPLDGAIVGHALHTGRFALPDALATLGEVISPDRRPTAP